MSPDLNLSSLYAGVAALTVVLLVFLTPPLLVSDEPSHFYRAYQLSTGELRGSAQGGKSGSVLPRSLMAFEEQALRAPIRQSGHSGAAFPLRQTWSKPIPLEPDRRAFVDFTQMSIYAPFTYLPQALGIALGRWGGANVLTMFLLGRLLNGLVAVALTTWALRVLPGAQPFGVVAALLPMNLVQFASLSGDAMLISCGFLFTALVLRASRDGRWLRGRLAAAMLCGVAVVAAKIVYAPLLFLGLWPALAQWRQDNPKQDNPKQDNPKQGNRQLAAAQAAIVVAALAVALGWLVTVRDLMLPTREDVFPSERMRWVVSHLIEFGALLLQALATQAWPLLLQSVGVLSWSALSLPGPVYALVLVGLGCGLVATAPCMSRAAAGWTLVLVGACMALIAAALFLTWSTGYDTIEGIQGRYFNPLLLAGGLAVASLRPRRVALLDGRYGVGLACAGLAGLLWRTVVDYRLF